MSYDVIIYRKLDYRVTRIYHRNAPRHGRSGSAEYYWELAHNRMNCIDNAVAVVDHDAYRVGDIFKETNDELRQHL